MRAMSQKHGRWLLRNDTWRIPVASTCICIWARTATCTTCTSKHIHIYIQIHIKIQEQLLNDERPFSPLYVPFPFREVNLPSELLYYMKFPPTMITKNSCIINTICENVQNLVHKIFRFFWDRLLCNPCICYVFQDDRWIPSPACVPLRVCATILGSMLSAILQD